MGCGYNKKTKVSDDKFPTPDMLNKIPCVGSDRYLVSVPEYVKIINVCQDEYNPSVVYMDFKLNGVYNFKPSCWITRVDSDTSYAQKTARAPLFKEYWRSDPKLTDKDYINTACKTKTYTLAFDFGSVIPQFLESSRVYFSLRMDGTLPEELNLPDFRNLEKRVEDSYEWDKGPLPNPLYLDYDSSAEKLTVYFEFEDGIPCTCNILCQTVSGSLNDIQYCEDKVSRVTLDYAGGENIDDLILQFTDGIGNNTTMKVEPVVDLKPNKPSVIHLANPRRVELGLRRITESGKKLKVSTAYQIWKYTDSISSAVIWKDWSLQEPGTFIDMDIIPGKTYGYAVRYKGEYEDLSILSDWVTVTV